MKKVVVFGNCQSGPIAKMLRENNDFNDSYQIIETLPVQLITTPEQTEELVAAALQADVFIYQHVNDPSWPRETQTGYLLQLVKRDATLISFPSIYFDGYFPHLGSMLGWGGPLRHVHDYFISYCFVKDLSVEQTRKLILTKELYSKDNSIDFVTLSIKNLNEREIENNTDIRVSSFIQEHYRKVKLFNQFNHPRTPLIEYVVKDILARLNIDAAQFSSDKDYLGGIVAPIYVSTHNNLTLEFPERFNLYKGEGGKKNIDVITRQFFRFYREKNKEEIFEQIKRNKPFVIDLAERCLART